VFALLFDFFQPFLERWQIHIGASKHEVYERIHVRNRFGLRLVKYDIGRMRLSRSLLTLSLLWSIKGIEEVLDQNDIVEELGQHAEALDLVH